MKDSPAIIVASGLAGLLGAFFPVARGWVLEQSVSLMGFEISAESLGFFVVTKVLFVPSLVMLALGLVAMKRPTRALGAACLLPAVLALAAWYLQKSTNDSLSFAGVAPALGLFLLLVSGLGGLIGSTLLLAFPPKKQP